jgi:TatD DNase family protein
MKYKEYSIIDSHCHPQFPQFELDRAKVIERAITAGVGMVCVGTGLDTSEQAVVLAKQYEGLWASVGIHPHHASDGDLNENNLSESLAAAARLIKDESVVAIGEVGLDYYHADPASYGFQKELLLSQMSLARQTNKPLIIHCRDAHEDMLKLLPAHDCRGVIHSFNGSKELAEEYIRRGFHIGLNAIVTYAKAYEDMVIAIPMGRLLLETDAPYLAPAPYRGQRNEPVYILEIAQAVAKMKGVTVDDLITRTTQNTKQLFDI